MMKKEGETGTLRIVSLEGDLELDKAHKCHLFYGPKTIRLFLLTPWNYTVLSTKNLFLYLAPSFRSPGE